jgi:hypothetical protein
MKKIFLTIALVLALLALAVPGWAADYYFATAGNDTTGNGSQGNPWQTISKLASLTLQPNDTVNFNGGDVFNGLMYREVISGTEGNPIIFRSYGSGKAILIRGTYRAKASWTDIGDGRYSMAATGCSQLLEDWIPLPPATSNALSDGYWYLESATTLYYKPYNGTWTSQIIYTMVNTAPGPFYLDNAPITDVTFSNIKFIGPFYTTNGATPQTRITFDSCEFWGSYGNALWFCTNTGKDSSYINVTNCTFQYNNNNMYFVATGTGSFSNCNIQNNVILNSNYRAGSVAYSDSGDQDGISIQTCSDFLIENNIISGRCSRYAGIHLWFPATFTGTGNIIRNNYIHDIQGAGIIYGGGDTDTCNVEIYNNIIVNTGYIKPYTTLTGWAQTEGDTYEVALTSDPTVITEDNVKLIRQASLNDAKANTSSWYWESNVLYVHASTGNPSSNGKTYIAKIAYPSGTGSAAGIFLPRSQDTESVIYNNIIVDCIDSIDFYSAGNHFTLKNNISYSPGRYHIKANTAVLNNIFDYNCYYSSLSSPFYANSTAKNYTDWKTWNGDQDENSITSDPLLTDSTPDEAADVKLQAGSPCINAGDATVNTIVTHDYEGKPRLTKNSIGAYEYWSTGGSHALPGSN